MARTEEPNTVLPAQCGVAEYISLQIRRVRKYASLDTKKHRLLLILLRRWEMDNQPPFAEFGNSLSLSLTVSTEDLLIFSVMFSLGSGRVAMPYQIRVVPTFGGFYTRVEGDNMDDACRLVQLRMQRWLTSAVPSMKNLEDIYA